MKYSLVFAAAAALQPTALAAPSMSPRDLSLPAMQQGQGLEPVQGLQQSVESNNNSPSHDSAATERESHANTDVNDANARTLAKEEEAESKSDASTEDTTGARAHANQDVVAAQSNAETEDTRAAAGSKTSQDGRATEAFAIAETAEKGSIQAAVDTVLDTPGGPFAVYAELEAEGEKLKTELTSKIEALPDGTISTEITAKLIADSVKSIGDFCLKIPSLSPLEPLPAVPEQPEQPTPSTLPSQAPTEPIAPVDPVTELPPVTAVYDFTRTYVQKLASTIYTNPSVAEQIADICAGIFLKIAPEQSYDFVYNTIVEIGSQTHEPQIPSHVPTAPQPENNPPVEPGSLPVENNVTDVRPETNIPQAPTTSPGIFDIAVKNCPNDICKQVFEPAQEMSNRGVSYHIVDFFIKTCAILPTSQLNLSKFSEEVTQIPSDSPPTEVQNEIVQKAKKNLNDENLATLVDTVAENTFASASAYSSARFGTPAPSTVAPVEVDDECN